MEQMLGTFFERLGIFNPELRRQMRKHLNTRYLQKGERIYCQGDEITDYALKVDGGLTRSFYIDKNGKEITSCFDNAKIGCITSDIPKNGASWLSSTTTEALTSFYIVEFPAAELAKLGQQYPEIFGVTYKLAMESLRFYQECVHVRTNLSARERVIWFNQRLPEFNGLAKEWQIASYLGIHQVTLSNIRAQLRSEGESMSCRV